MVPYLEAMYHAPAYQGNRFSRVASQMCKGIWHPRIFARIATFVSIWSVISLLRSWLAFSFFGLIWITKVIRNVSRQTQIVWNEIINMFSRALQWLYVFIGSLRTRCH